MNNVPSHSFNRFWSLFIVSMLVLLFGCEELQNIINSSTVNLSPPMSIHASQGEFSNYVRVTWLVAENSSSYTVYRALGQSGPWTELATTSGTYYIDYSVNPGVRYWYSVASIGPDGESISAKGIPSEGWTMDGLLSSDASLQNLTVSVGTLTPSFSAEMLTYEIIVPNGTASITVQATARNANANVQIAGIARTSASIALQTPETVVLIVVTAEDGTEQEYSLTVGIAVGNGTISPVVE